MVVLFSTLYFINAVLLLCGVICRRYYSEFPDTTAGFHVAKWAVVNERAWKEANRYAGKLFLAASAGICLINTALLFIGIIAMHGPVEAHPVYTGVCVGFGVAAILITLVVSVLLTKRHVRKTVGK